MTLRRFGAAMTLALLTGSGAMAQDCFLGEIKMFAGNFAPRNYAMADGQLIKISDNAALFSILGTTYGGDGRTNFALPDLRGRMPIGAGQGPGQPRYALGQRGGASATTLTVNQLPPHSHTVNARSEPGDTNAPTGALPANDGTDRVYGTGGASTQMNSAMIGNTGGGALVPTMSPYLAITPIICIAGIYPSRN